MTPLELLAWLGMLPTDTPEEPVMDPLVVCSGDENDAWYHPRDLSNGVPFDDWHTGVDPATKPARTGRLSHRLAKLGKSRG